MANQTKPLFQHSVPGFFKIGDAVNEAIDVMLSMVPELEFPKHLIIDVSRHGDVMTISLIRGSDD